MQTTELFELTSAILASVGGASAIIFGLSSYLGKVWAERILSKEKAKYAEDLEAFKTRLVLEAESHKVKLKKSEFIFSKEYEAASKLVSINRDIVPTFAHPDMDWEEACNDMARNSGKTENILHQYLKEHGAVLPAGVKHLITISYGLSGENKFEAINGGVTLHGNTTANLIYEHLKQAELEMLQQVQKQVSI